MITYQNNNDLTKEQWLANRHLTLGASECCTIIYGSPYSSNLELFWEKVTGCKMNFQNLRTYTGHKSESICDSFFPYYEGNDESIYVNADKNNRVKSCVNRNRTCFNSKYPHLSCTVDRYILPEGHYAGRGEGVLEYKNTQSRILKAYAPHLPPANVIQVCVQMMLEELKYGELFYYIDNLTCLSYPFLRSQFRKMEQKIIAVTTPFWDNVVKARPIYNAMYEAKRTNNLRLAASLERDLAQLEPPAQNTAGYMSFINQRYKDRIMTNAKMLPGTEEMLAMAKKHKELGEKIEKFKEQRQGIEINIKNIIADNRGIDFGNKGKVTFFQYESRRIFNNDLTKTA